MIALSMVTNERVRKTFVIALFLEITILILKTQIGRDFEGTGALEVFMTGYMILAFSALNIAFSVIIHKILSLSERIIFLELNENQKYKHMFNAIEDSIFLIKHDQVSFLNKPAQRVYREFSHDLEEILNQPKFYLFSDFQKEEKVQSSKALRGKFAQNSSLKQMKEKCLSIKDLLTQRIEIVNNNVFTNSKEISQSTQMD